MNRADKLIDKLLRGSEAMELVESLLVEDKVKYVGDWVDLLKHKLITWDKKNGNTYSLGHLMRALKEIETALRNVSKKKVDKENSVTAKDVIYSHLNKGFGPADYVVKQIDSFMDTGKLPTLPSGYGVAGEEFGTIKNEKVAPGWKASEFEIATPIGKQKVQGYVKGILGVNTQHRSGWTLTHIPTGMAILKTSTAIKATKAGNDLEQAFHGLQQVHSVDGMQNLIKANISAYRDIQKKYK